MEYVRKALEYRFWILAGIALLLPVIGWATVMGSLESDTQRRTTKLTGAFKDVEELGKGAQPNRGWEEAVNELASDLETRVNAAWEELYADQASELTWPSDVQNAMSELGPDHLQVRQIYRSQYADEVARTARLAEPAILQASLRFEDWGNQPPTAEEMRNAQEDIWVERALLKVIGKTNQPAESLVMAPIKYINNLAIGLDVRDPPSVSIKGGLSMPRGTTGTEAPGRYVRQTEQYNLMRFHLALTMDHRRVPDLLANLGSSPVPIEVTQISLFQQEGGDAAQIAADPSLANVEIYGNVFLFKPPPSRQQQMAAGGAEQPAAGQ